MKSLKFAAALAALALLAGCQAGSTGVSTYGGSLQHDGGNRVSDSTVRKKVGKVRRVKPNGEIYYVNKYVRVKRSAKKRVVRKAYAAKRTTKSVKAISKALKVSTKKVARRTKAAPRIKTSKSKSPKNLNALIAKHAKAHGVPYKLARAVVTVESGGRVNARGAVGEVGLMQLRPRTARGMGYKGKMKDLYNPDTNLAYGMKYLGEAYRRGGKSTCGAILKYNAGHYAKKWNPTSRKYCKRVKKLMKKG